MQKIEKFQLINYLILSKIIINFFILYLLLRCNNPFFFKSEYIINILYIRLLIIIYIILSLIFDIFLLKKNYLNYKPYILLELYTVIYLIIFFIIKNIFNFFIYSIIFPFSLISLLMWASDVYHRSIFIVLGLAISLLIMWIYTIIIVPICIYKIIKIFINENILNKK